MGAYDEIKKDLYVRLSFTKLEYDFCNFEKLVFLYLIKLQFFGKQNSLII